MSNRMGTVAQILLAVLFLSIAALLLSAFGNPGRIIGDTLINTLSEVKLLNSWVELIYGAKDMFHNNSALSYAVSGSMSLTIQGIVSVTLTCLMDSLIIGSCIHLANRVMGRTIGSFRGGMVLPTVFGALVGCLLCGSRGLFSAENIQVITMIVEEMLIILGIVIMIRGQLPKARGGVIWHTLWPIFLGAMMSSVLAMYVSVLTLVLQGVLTPVLPWITGAGMVTIVLAIIFYVLETVTTGRRG